MKNLRINCLLPILVLLISELLVGCSADQKNKTATQTEKSEPATNTVPYNTDNPESMIQAVIEECGGIDKLKSLKDVEFDYSYESPDGKKDVSKERYIFENEISWARYSEHEVNVSPNLEGSIVQFYDGVNTHVYNNSEPVDDPKVVGTGNFLRRANYMWFTMMFKLADPGVIYKYEGQKEIDGRNFYVVKISYDSLVTGKAQNDTYVVNINPDTRLIESFDFSLPAFGVEQPVLHAELTYEEIEGIMVITKRVMTAPAPDGKGMVPMVEQALTNVKFNNGFTRDQLSKEI